MSDQISIPLDADESGTLKDLQPGDDICLSYVKGKVTANDGESVSFTPSEIEVDEAGCGPMDESSDKSANDNDGDEPTEDGDKKPVAIVALGFGKKK